jgi:hypothetical protein
MKEITKWFRYVKYDSLQFCSNFSGSANEYSGLRTGIYDLYMKDRAQNMVKNRIRRIALRSTGSGLVDRRFALLELG